MASIDVTHLAPEAFTGRTAIITGGCSGIGLATAKLMHSLGCNLVLGDLRPPSHKDEFGVASSSSKPPYFQQCDISKWDSVKALFEKAISEFGSIDIVCANAGINDLGDPFFSDELVDEDGILKEPNLTTLDVNVKGTAYTVLLGIHYLRANKRGGSIVMTASLAGYFPTVGMPLYTASKHGKTTPAPFERSFLESLFYNATDISSALVGLMRALAPPALSSGVAISLVAPGMTKTPLLRTLPGIERDMNNQNVDEESLQSLFKSLQSAGIPSQTPDAVAQAIVYLIEKGKDAAGMGLFVQSDEVINLESELQGARPEWLVQRMQYLLSSEIPVWKK